MKTRELADILNGSRSERLLENLYGREAVGRERLRYLNLTEGMVAEGAASDEIRLFSAPGRTELGGNHTDHNRGRVLAAAVQMDAVAAVTPRADSNIFFRSAGYNDTVIRLDGAADLSPKPEEKETTAALIRGIASEFAARGERIGGFNANVSSTVLQGSGLSSSAALEVLVAKIFDSLYGKGRRCAIELAQIGQKAENVFFGKPCGLMDQAASASGGAVAIDFADPASPAVKQIEFDPLAAGFALCVVNTRGNHADLTPDYAAIPAEMNSVARFFGKSFLRETDLPAVLARAAEIRKAAGDRALLRAIHFFNEDSRAADMALALEDLASAEGEEKKREAMARFLRLANESGASSQELLQNIYSPGDPGVQEISLALAVSREFFKERKITGVSRVHGGGFAGTIQTYVPAGDLDSYKDRMETLFGEGALTVLRVRQAGAIEIEF